VFSLIPFYLAGSILAGALLVLVSRNVRNKAVGTWIRWAAIMVTPALVLVFFVFTGWQRQRTYEMDPLMGRPALGYLTAGAPQEMNREFAVVLRRVSGQNHECFEAFDSKSLTHYLNAHAAQPVRVMYTITYDFFRPRNIQIQSVAEFGPASDVVLRDVRETGERNGLDSNRVPCFRW
jgi:hypothetical protein